MKKYNLPTGYLFVKKYTKGELETLSIGDYGKHHNVKADFLGFNKEIHGVPNTACMPLSEKWVITLSTQYGCIMKCNFCMVPQIAFKGNAIFQDLKNQLYEAIKLFPSVHYTERLNIHFARMGEPIYNEHVFIFATWLFQNKQIFQEETGLRCEVIHPVLTTSLPRKFKLLKTQLRRWLEIKNLYNGQAGLQLSINSTSEDQRTEMFQDMQLHLTDLAEECHTWPNPIGRKYCLNFALASSYECDAKKLASLFDPNKFMVKITPIHNNEICGQNKIETKGGYDSFEPYQKAEEDLKKEGFDVLIFVPSLDEEHGLVTCGNAILGGSKLKLKSNINPNILGI